MQSEQQGLEQVPAIVYHIDKNTQEWEQVDSGILEFIPNLDGEGVIIGHSIVVTKFVRDNPPNDHLTATVVIIKSDLESEKEYCRQESTVISWNENNLNEQVAVTFSDKKTCDKVWKHLCSFIGKNPFEIGKLPPPNQVDMPRQDNLEKLVISVGEKQQAISYYIINKTKFLDELLSVLQKVVNQGNPQSISLVYRILSGVISYNDSRIIQILFSSTFFPVILRVYQQCNHTDLDYIQLLNERFSLINLIPLNQEITEKVKASHYISFFKDVVMTPIVSTLEATLELSIKQCNMEIFNHITTEQFMQKLRDKLEGEEAPEAIKFIYEELIFTKQFSDDVKIKLVDKYYSQGIIASITRILADTNLFTSLHKSTQLEIIQVLFKICSYNQKSFVDYLRTNIGCLESLAYYFHFEADDVVDCVQSLIRNLIQHSLNRKPPIEILTSGFFNKEAGHIKDSHSNHLPYLRQTQRMIELMILAVENNEGERVTKLLEILPKYNIFYLLINQPLTKVQKIQRIKLANVVISEDSRQLLTVHQALIQSKYFRTIILWLNECYSKNNVLESSIMNLLEKVALRQKTSLMRQVQDIQLQLPQCRIVAKIMSRMAELRQESNSHVQKHQQILENQLQQRYLNQESDTPISIRKASFGDPKQEMEQSLKLMAVELGKKESQEDIVCYPKEKKPMQFSFSFADIT